MSLKRLGLILLAVYLVFVVGGFANNFPELRWFNHAFMTCLMSAWLAWRVYRDRNLPKAPLNIIVFALLGLGFLSVPFSESPRMALEYMWLPVVFAVIYFFIVNAFHHAQHKFILEIVYFVTAVVIFLSFLQIGSVFFGWGIVRSAGQGWINFIGQGVPLPWQQDMRIFLPLGISTQVAGFVAPVIIITLSRILWTKQQNRALWIILLVLLSIILFLTFSRGGLISLAVGLLSFLILYLVGNERFSRLLTPRIVGLGIVTLIVLAVLGNSVVSLASIGSRITGDQARFDLWNSAVEMIADNPVTGVGTGLYGRTLREYRDATVADDRLSTAHNIYLNVASENGIGIFLVLVGVISTTASR
ncbi:MAG: O-antigen ligase family protein [Chloroflexota bacterium]